VDVQWSFVVVAKNWCKILYTLLVLILNIYTWCCLF